MLILILIDVQHLWESAIGFEKDSDRQNDLSSGSLQPVTSPPPHPQLKFPILPPTPYHYWENPVF